MTIDNEELSDGQLFDEALGDGETQEQQQVEQISDEPANTQEAQASTQTQDERQQVDDNAAQVPSWRVREINEEKRRIAEENDRIKAELAELRRISQQQQRPQQTETKVNEIDPLIDPKGYAKQVREEIRQELIAERREESLQTAAEKYGDEFKEAYSAATKQVDTVLKARMQESRNPGETLIQWHRENKQRAEIGNDLSAYKQRLREEALKDPEFRKAAMEAWRNEGQHTPQTNGRQRVELPPSLSGASRASQALRSQDNEEVPDRELFQQIAG